MVDQVLYGACVATQIGDHVIEAGCDAWNSDGTCVEFNEDPFWGCVERDTTVTKLED